MTDGTKAFKGSIFTEFIEYKGVKFFLNADLKDLRWQGAPDRVESSLPMLKTYKNRALSCEEPKPSEAFIIGHGPQYFKPSAVKSQAIATAFRPSWARKTLLMQWGSLWTRGTVGVLGVGMVTKVLKCHVDSVGMVGDDGNGVVMAGTLSEGPWRVMGVVIDRGNPWVKTLYPYPYLANTLPVPQGMGFVPPWVRVSDRKDYIKSELYLQSLITIPIP
ncbi:hypothetical protein EI94DRAFT_1710957 [Lactarius quietus]|nr:hypothetical protein EI94DRAFT_1710957 [Lactarius quietus]